MSFYGNISNAGKTNLTFDKIYPNRKTMDEKAATDGVFIGRFVLVEYDDNTFSRRRGYLNPNEDMAFGGYKLYQDSTYQSPYYLVADTEKGYGVKEGDLIYTEVAEKYSYYRCSGGTNDNDNTALFTYITETNKDLTDYTINYILDKQQYSNKFVDGWDSTIWQKAIINGEECYQMIATLNSKTPHFDIVAEAPAAEPIAPHFGIESTNMNYTLHMPTNYGFRIKEAESSELSDESYKEILKEGEKQGTEVLKHYDIYYNGKALDVENKLERFYAEGDNYITLAPSGTSEKQYVKHDKEGQQVIETANDIQELSIHLPTIGNIATELWDLLYGDKNDDGTFKDVRNDNLDWESSEGVRFIVKDESTGNYEYLPKRVETIAGIINSTHDLMGRIIKYQTSLKDADLNHIYYRALPEEGENNFRPGFFMKTPSNELISFDNLNKEYNLAFFDYKEYIAGKNPQYLTQYIPNYYYISAGSGIEGKNNYLCEIGEYPTLDANYYTLHNPAPELINLIEWNPTPEDKYDELEPEEIISYYYREEDGYDLINNSLYYKYIKEAKKLPEMDKEYYSVQASRIYTLNFYNPEKYTSDEGNKHKSTIDEETGKTYYTGYFYYDDEAEQLVPVYGGTPFIEGEEYYLLKDYYFEAGIDENNKNTNIYYLNGEKLEIDGIKGNPIYVVNMIDFNTQEIYELKENGTVYTRVKNVENIDQQNGIYYTLETTLLNGYLEVEKEIEGEEAPKVEVLYTNFYIPDTYYYKTSNADYLLDRGSKLQKNKEYYFISPQEIKVAFYEPNKYYYYSKTLYNEGKDPDKLDDSLVMRTATDPDVVVQKLEGKEDFVYYLKRKAYIVNDTSNHLKQGMVWNVNTDKIPEGVVLGALFNDIVEELKAKGYNVEKKYKWKELKGFSQDLNTINGLILQLNKLYSFDDELTRDINTVQGMFNTLRDNFAKFDTLTPGYLLAVNEYGQLDSQNPGELTLAGYEVGKEAKAIQSSDTINEAFGKIEFKVNVLNADASTVGSVAHQIAQIVEVDGGAVDKLKEIAAWIIDDQTGAAKIIADVAINAGDIAALENLVGSKTVAAQIAEAIAAENLNKYALASELNSLAEKISNLEGLIDKTKADAWNENLNAVSTLQTLIDADKANAWNAALDTIAFLLEKVQELEERLDTLEKPIETNLENSEEEIN